MKKFLLAFVFAVMICGGVFAQYYTHAMEHEYHDIGVFNPQWETDKTLNPVKYEHITGWFREKLAEVILSAVKQKRVKVYDERKRELNLDTVIGRIISFEQRNFGKVIGKDSVFEYIRPFISAYRFEEVVDYKYDDVSLSKTVKAYCPYMVRYKQFSGEKEDSVCMPLFWIFPEGDFDSTDMLHIQDTVLYVHALKYPNQMPFCSNLFSFVQQGKVKAFKPDGSEFSSPKQVEDLFVVKNDFVFYDENTGQESMKSAFSDIMPEDIIAIRIGEGWDIDRRSLNIRKRIYFYLPLYRYDDERFGQLGIRVYNGEAGH